MTGERCEGCDKPDRLLAEVEERMLCDWCEPMEPGLREWKVCPLCEAAVVLVNADPDYIRSRWVWHIRQEHPGWEFTSEGLEAA